MARLSPEEAAVLGLPMPAAAATPRTLTAEEAQALGLPNAPLMASHKPGSDVREITLGNTAIGGLEGAASLGSGILAYPAGLAAGAASLALGRGKEPLDFDAAREWRAKTQNALTYAPRTDSGQGFVSAVGRLMAPWTKSAEYVGQKVGDATGSPTLGGATEEVFGAVVNPLTLSTLGKGLKTTKVAEPPRLAVRPEAQTLQRSGVKGLTAGQMADPNSLPAILERVSADHPFGLRPQRDAAKESFMRAAQDKGTAPGAAPPATTDLQARLAEHFANYDQVYAPLKGHQVAPQVLDNLLNASSMPSRGVDARTIAAAKGEIENALSVLGPKPQAPAPSTLLGPNGQPLPAAPAPPMKASVGDLIKARENVREALRGARKADDFDRARLLGAAEQEFTTAIESALPPKEQAALKAADTQYARLMRAATAAPAGQTTFTPGQYLRRVEQGSGARRFKTGSAGDLQDLGEAALEVFAEAPMTGFRPGVLSALPGAKYWGAPVSRALNSPAGRRFLFDPRTRLELTGSPEAAPLSLGAVLARAMETRPVPELAIPRLRLGMAAAHDREGQ